MLEAVTAAAATNTLTRHAMSTGRASSRGLPGFQTNPQISSGSRFRLYYKPFARRPAGRLQLIFSLERNTICLIHLSHRNRNGPPFSRSIGRIRSMLGACTSRALRSAVTACLFLCPGCAPVHDTSQIIPYRSTEVWIMRRCGRALEFVRKERPGFR